LNLKVQERREIRIIREAEPVLGPRISSPRIGDPQANDTAAHTHPIASRDRHAVKVHELETLVIQLAGCCSAVRSVRQRERFRFFGTTTGWSIAAAAAMRNTWTAEKPPLVVRQSRLGFAPQKGQNRVRALVGSLVTPGLDRMQG
jgi:hypothetical protein